MSRKTEPQTRQGIHCYRVRVALRKIAISFHCSLVIFSFVAITCFAQAVTATQFGTKVASSERVQELSWESKNEISKSWALKGMRIFPGKGIGLFAKTGDDSKLLLKQKLTVPGGKDVLVRMAVSKGSFAQLFWGAPHKRINSARLPLITDGKIHEYRFRAPYDLIGKLRFDPTDKKTTIRIESIAIPVVKNQTLNIRSVYWDNVKLEKGKWQRLNIVLENTSRHALDVGIYINAPENIDIKGSAQKNLRIDRAPSKLKSVPKLGQHHIVEASWEVRSQTIGEAKLEISVIRSNGHTAKLPVAAKFEKEKEIKNVQYIPVPVETPPTSYIIGAHYFPGWKEGTHFGWSRIAPYPSRKPLLGWYDEGSPEVFDWEVKWAMEHGISFFMMNWFREKGNEGRPVQTRIEHAIRDGLFNSKFSDKFKFSIMFANSKRTGISGPRDLLKNVLPFWIKNYFSHPSYLIINNKPVLAIHQWDKFEGKLGKTSEQIAETMRQVQQILRKSGFDGILLLANQRPISRKQAKKKAYDYTFSWQGANNKLGKVKPSSSHIPVVSMGWNSVPWGGKKGFQLPPSRFKKQLLKAKRQMDKLPEGHLGKQLLILDHWNEWGEGHYIAPHREYGFGYLDAVRDVFTDYPKKHHDILPEDVGLGPYDSLYRKALESQITDIHNPP